MFFYLRFLNFKNGEIVYGRINELLNVFNDRYTFIESIKLFFYLNDLEYSDQLFKVHKEDIDKYHEKITDMTVFLFRDVPKIGKSLDYLIENENHFNEIKFKISELLIGKSYIDKYFSKFMIKAATDIKSISVKTKIV